jgi:hypothetical protein
MTDLSPNTIISLDMWNAATVRTRFPAYQVIFRNSFLQGGAIDAYRFAGNSFILGSIEDNITRYNEYRDTRSNYMSRSVTFSSPNTWLPVNNFTSRLNDYNFVGRRSARLNMNTSTGIISTLNTSVYLIYANIIISNVSTSTYAEMRIFKTIGGASIISSKYELIPITAHSAFLQVSALSIYDADDYRVEFRFGNSGTAIIQFGYTEFIGNKSGCGAFS